VGIAVNVVCYKSKGRREMYRKRTQIKHGESTTQNPKLPFNREESIMNAFTLLKADHKKVAGIMEKLDATTERGVKTREELFAQLKTELDVHARIEEKILYPALKEVDKTRDITFEGIEEHHVIKQLLAELDKLGKDEETWTAKFSVLKENVEHHVEEEEGEMFPKANKALTEEEIEELGTRLEAAKEKELAAAAAG
jgi:hemerythrin superfamily protein